MMRNGVFTNPAAIGGNGVTDQAQGKRRPSRRDGSDNQDLSRRTPSKGRRPSRSDTISSKASRRHQTPLIDDEDDLSLDEAGTDGHLSYHSSGSGLDPRLQYSRRQPANQSKDQANRSEYYEGQNGRRSRSKSRPIAPLPPPRASRASSARR